ncbi:MAG: efflux RND transporter periplasmic adaptor subunit [Anaerolineales bacterium]|nr:efflux RND transporter periplasmic adaptor subunit [Anaerolineales bacterium]
MKRLSIGISIVAAIILIGGAGYIGFAGQFPSTNKLDSLLIQLGLLDARNIEEAKVQPPITVEVTRGDVQQTVTAPGRLVGMREVALRTEVEGWVNSVLVRPGDHVQQGETLLSLDRSPLELALQEAQIKLHQATLAYDQQLQSAALAVNMAESNLENARQENQDARLEAQYNLEKAQIHLSQAQYKNANAGITIAYVRLTQAQSALADAQKAYDTAWEPARDWELQMTKPTGIYPNLGPSIKEQLESERDMTAAILAAQEANLQVAQAEYQQAISTQDGQNYDVQALEQEVALAELQVEQLNRGVDPRLELELEKAKAELAGLEAAGVDPLLALAVEKAETDLEAAGIKAPFDGIVLEVNAGAGEQIGPGNAAVVLADPTALEVLVNVIEEDLPLVQAGQPVDLFFDAAPETGIIGQVSRIVPQRTSDERPLYPVYIAITSKSPGELTPGMTADASIIIAQRTGALILPRSLVRARQDGAADVRIWENGQILNRTITVGLRGDVFVEILDGLVEGQQVVGE